MENLSFLKRSLLFVAVPLLSASLVLSSCDDDDFDDDDNTVEISGNASGAQEVPAVSSGGAATLSGTYNVNTNRLQYDVNYTGLSGNVTMAHFHGPALAGVSAPPIIDLSVTTNGVNGRLSGTVMVHDTTEVHLLAGRLYYNLHTAMHPGGEIRGQVIVSEE